MSLLRKAWKKPLCADIFKFGLCTVANALSTAQCKMTSPLDDIMLPLPVRETKMSQADKKNRTKKRVLSTCVFMRWNLKRWCEREHTEREQLEEQGRPLELRKTSGPAGLLRGRSGCVDSLLQQMKEQKRLCLLSPAHLHDAKDAT